MTKDVRQQNQRVLTPPVVLIDAPAKSFAEGMGAGVL